MGGTGNPIPDSNYLSSVEALYLSQYSGYNFQPVLDTPEQFCPIVCNRPASRTWVSATR